MSNLYHQLGHTYVQPPYLAWTYICPTPQLRVGHMYVQAHNIMYVQAGHTYVQVGQTYVQVGHTYVRSNNASTVWSSKILKFYKIHQSYSISWPKDSPLIAQKHENLTFCLDFIGFWDFQEPTEGVLRDDMVYTWQHQHCKTAFGSFEHL